MHRHCCCCCWWCQRQRQHVACPGGRPTAAPQVLPAGLPPLLLLPLLLLPAQEQQHPLAGVATGGGCTCLPSCCPAAALAARARASAAAAAPATQPGCPQPGQAEQASLLLARWWCCCPQQRCCAAWWLQVLWGPWLQQHGCLLRGQFQQQHGESRLAEHPGSACQEQVGQGPAAERCCSRGLASQAAPARLACSAAVEHGPDAARVVQVAAPQAAPAAPPGEPQASLHCCCRGWSVVPPETQH